MSKHNYTNYAKNYAEKAEQKPVEAAEVDEVVETVVEDVVEVAEPAEPVPVVGNVSGCNYLNIRKEPTIESEVLAKVAAKTVLVIDEDNSTEGWYSVCTPDGIKGFCMKNFVTL